MFFIKRLGKDLKMVLRRSSSLGILVFFVSKEIVASTSPNTISKRIEQDLFENVIFQEAIIDDTRIVQEQGEKDLKQTQTPTPQQVELKKHTFWSLGSFVSTKDKATGALPTKGHSRSFLVGYDYAVNPMLKAGVYFSTQRGRSTSDSFYTVTTSGIPQPIHSRTHYHSATIHPYLSYNFNSWLSTYVSAGQGWSATRFVKNVSNPVYGVAGANNVQGETTISRYNSSSRDVAAYLSAVKAFSNIVLQGQVGAFFEWNVTNKYILYEPYTIPQNYNTVPRDRSNTRQGTGLIRLVYSGFENVAPYIDVGTICHIKRPFVVDSLTSRRIYRSRFARQLGGGIRLFTKNALQGGISFAFIDGRNQVQTKAINVDIRYNF